MHQVHWFSVVKKARPIGATRANRMRYWEILPEKWSRRYKKSINCNNPKGFSQKAHCAGKHKKNEIDEYARTLKNARQQGVGLRFPKSAIKSNPARFRPYNR